MCLIFNIVSLVYGKWLKFFFFGVVLNLIDGLFNFWEYCENICDFIIIVLIYVFWFLINYLLKYLDFVVN